MSTKDFQLVMMLAEKVGKVGMYDLVAKEFLVNQGTGDFLYG